MVGGGVRVGAAGHHVVGQRLEPGVAAQAADLRPQRLQRQPLDLAAGPAHPPPTQAVGAEPRAVRLDGGEQVVDARAVGRHGAHHRHPPAFGVRARSQRRRVPQVAHGAVGALAVGLVDDEHVGDLEDAGLGRLDAVAHPGCEQHHGGVGRAGDLDLGLAHADRLEQHDVAARGVEHAQGLRRRPGQPAEVAARGHRADEDLGVGGVVRHPDPVAEQRTAGERRRRVDGEHADAVPGGPVGGDERVGRRRLADAGRPGDADDVGATGIRRDAAPSPRAARGGRPRRGR